MTGLIVVGIFVGIYGAAMYSWGRKDGEHSGRFDQWCDDMEAARSGSELRCPE